MAPDEITTTNARLKAQNACSAAPSYGVWDGRLWRWKWNTKNLAPRAQVAIGKGPALP